MHKIINFFRIECQSWIAKIVIVFMFIFGLYHVAKGVIELGLAIESKNWSIIQGKIKWSHFSSDNYKANKGGGTFIGELDLRYEFVLNGVTYRGERIRFGNLEDGGNVLYWFDDVYSKFKQYPKDKIVTIHYKETNPKLSVLEPGVHFLSFSRLVTGLILLGLPYWFIFIFKTDDEIEEENNKGNTSV